MAWVCPLCSSNTEEKKLICAVCGQVRPGSGLDFDMNARMGAARHKLAARREPYPVVAPKEAYEAAVALRQSDPEAGFWLLLTYAYRGYAPAENEVGDCYYYGWGVELDYERAVIWFRRAAGHGLCRAQYNLGFCYATGRGTARDKLAAIYWYEKAARQGSLSAQAALKKLKTA